MPSLLRWSALAVLLLVLILLPFFLYERPITDWTQQFLQTERPRWLVGASLAALLAIDLVLPIPSSIISTASGYLLGMWPGSAATLAGMSLACVIGYWLGATAGRGVTRRFVGDEELDRVSRAQARFGDWLIVLFRAVPVLAEASVLVAGVVRMPLRRFLLLATLSNSGISLTYAAVGAYALEVQSFLLACAAAVGFPAIAMLIVRRLE